MLNIEGLVKITKFEEMEGGKATKATVYFGTKKGKDSEEWENSFFKSILIGEANKKQSEVFEKDTIYITKGLVKNVSYQDKNKKNRSYLSLTIFDFIHGEDEIKAYINKKFGKAKEQEQQQQPSRTERKRR